MRGIFLDVLEVNIVVSVVFLVLLFLSGKLRERYGAGWMKLCLGLLVVRLLIPYNFSMPKVMPYTLPFSQIQLFNLQNIGQEEEKIDFPNKETVAGNMENAESKAEMGEKMEVGFSVRDSVWETIFSHTEIVPLIWIVGMGICFVYCMSGYAYFFFVCRKNLYPVIDASLRGQITELIKKFQVKVIIPVYQSHEVKSPMLAGLLIPKLILPDDKEKWTEIELELVIAHELCHYRHKDLWLKLLMTVAWCVNWFNPLVWLLKKQFFYELELACDSNVLFDYSEEMKETYARVILSFANEKGIITAFSTGFGESKKQMKKRIDYVLDSRGKRKGIISIVMTCILVLAIGFIVSCGYNLEEKSDVDKAQFPYSCYQIPIADGQINWGMNTDEVIKVLGDPALLESGDYGDTLTYDITWSGELGNYSQVVLYIGIDDKVYNDEQFSSGLLAAEMIIDDATKESILGSLADFYGELSPEGGETPIEIQLKEANPDYFYQYHFCDEWKAGMLAEASLERLKQVQQAADRISVPVDEKTPLMYVNFWGVDHNLCSIMLNASVLSSYLHVESYGN